jgi:hypothetical protein
MMNLSLPPQPGQGEWYPPSFVDATFLEFSPSSFAQHIVRKHQRNTIFPSIASAPVVKRSGTRRRNVDGKSAVDQKHHDYKLLSFAIASKTTSFKMSYALLEDSR